MAEGDKDPFLPPAVMATVSAVLAAVVVAFKPVPSPVPPRIEVLGEQIATADIAQPPSLPAADPTPVPSGTPVIVAERPAGARTSGSANPNPRATSGFIQIASIGANAPIVAVGLAKDGKMVTPKSAREVAWLDDGTFPGPSRNAILAGHRNWKGVQGSFARLEQAKPGDVVRIGMDGRVYTYRLSWVRIYDPRSAPVDELLGPSSHDVVTLVTCGGAFNQRTRHYEKRVVARAELVSTA